MNPALSAHIQDWCLRPTDLWDCETTRLLVRREWETLRNQLSWHQDDYNTAGYILNTPNFIASKRSISTWPNENQIYLEAPCSNELHLFYTENDLSLVEEDDLLSIGAVEKLDDALKFLGSVHGLVDCVTQLVRVIGVLKSPSPEVDVSYSHPTVPFSIFVSICNERSIVASARVAESILHEAMHLRLSLIQKVVDLLNPGSQGQAQYFAPWRQEERPANGILHGTFVFRAILEFFKRLASDNRDDQVIKYSEQRIREISSQLVQVRDFYKSPALSATGAELARQLANI